MRRYKKFSRRLGLNLLRFTQKIPTWFVVSSTVLLLSFLTIWFHGDLQIASLKDLLARPVLKVLFENAESIAIVTAVVLFIREAPDRKEQKHYEAWQVIDNAAAAKVPTSYARIKALQDLNDDGVSLQRLDVPDADLAVIKLPGAYLYRADLSGTNLSSADLSGALLLQADLSNADLSWANLSGAILSDANLSGAILFQVDLSGAILLQTNLGGVKDLTPGQVKAAKNWEEAHYDKDFRQQLGLPPETEQEL